MIFHQRRSLLLMLFLRLLLLLLLLLLLILVPFPQDKQCGGSGNSVDKAHEGDGEGHPAGELGGVDSRFERL